MDDGRKATQVEGAFERVTITYDVSPEELERRAAEPEKRRGNSDPPIPPAIYSFTYEAKNTKPDPE